MSKIEELEERIARLEETVNLQSRLLDALVKGYNNTTEILNVLGEMAGVKTEEESNIPPMLRVGRRYKPMYSKVEAIEGVRNSYGTIIEVSETDNFYQVVVDHGIEKGNPCHIFTDYVPKDKLNWKKKGK